MGKESNVELVVFPPHRDNKKGRKDKKKNHKEILAELLACKNT